MLMHDDGIQFARLLCELVANNESLNLQVVAEEMGLDWRQLDSILNDAVTLWEAAKVGEVDNLDRVRQVVATCAMVGSHMNQADVAAELRVLADTLDGGER